MRGRLRRAFAMMTAALLTASMLGIGTTAQVAADYGLLLSARVVMGGAPTAGSCSAVTMDVYGTTGQMLVLNLNPPGSCMNKGQTYARLYNDGPFVKSGPYFYDVRDIGRIYRIDLWVLGSDDWWPINIEIRQGTMAKLTYSPSKFDPGLTEPLKKTSGQTKLTEQTLPWIDDPAPSMDQPYELQYVAKDHLGADKGSTYTKSFAWGQAESVEFAYGVTSSAELQVGAKYDSPSTPWGSLSVDFRTTLKEEIQKNKVTRKEASVDCTYTYEKWVPKGRLRYIVVWPAARFGAATLDTGAAMGARWYKQCLDENVRDRDFAFGEYVPEPYATWIRTDDELKPYVPPGAPSSGPFILTDPDPDPNAPQLVDDKHVGFAKYGSGWKAQNVGYLGRSLWTPVRAGKAYRYAIWKAPLVTPGRYAVFVQYPKRNATTRRAKYQVFTSSGVVTKAKSQAFTAGRWTKLGAFDFGTEAKVRLTDRTGEGTRSGRRIVFDVVKFVPISAASGASPDRDTTGDRATKPDQVTKPDRITKPDPDAVPIVVAPEIRDGPEAALKLRLYPQEITAVVGMKKVISAWTCPANDRSPFGPDRTPGTTDDACDPVVADWSLWHEQDARLSARTGHKVHVQLAEEADNRIIATWEDLKRPGKLTAKPRPADAPVRPLLPPWTGDAVATEEEAG